MRKTVSGIDLTFHSLPKIEIQELANKTFYANVQSHAIDFLTYILTEEK